MTKAVLYSYPLVILCLIYAGMILALRSQQNATSPLGYCTASDANLPEDEKHAIALAKRFVERTSMGNAWELDGRFRVHADAGGYQIHVLFVCGYDTSGRPLLIPGGHCMVNISRDGKVEYGKAPGPSILNAKSNQIFNTIDSIKSDNCEV